MCKEYLVLERHCSLLDHVQLTVVCCTEAIKSDQQVTTKLQNAIMSAMNCTVHNGCKVLYGFPWTPPQEFSAPHSHNTSSPLPLINLKQTEREIVIWLAISWNNQFRKAVIWATKAPCERRKVKNGINIRGYIPSWLECLLP